MCHQCFRNSRECCSCRGDWGEPSNLYLYFLAKFFIKIEISGMAWLGETMLCQKNYIVCPHLEIASVTPALEIIQKLFLCFIKIILYFITLLIKFNVPGFGCSNKMDDFYVVTKAITNKV